MNLIVDHSSNIRQPWELSQRISFNAIFMKMIECLKSKPSSDWSCRTKHSVTRSSPRNFGYIIETSFSIKSK